MNVLHKMLIEVKTQTKETTLIRTETLRQRDIGEGAEKQTLKGALLSFARMPRGLPRGGFP
jgi:hypothetical protein